MSSDQDETASDRDESPDGGSDASRSHDTPDSKSAEGGDKEEASDEQENGDDDAGDGEEGEKDEKKKSGPPLYKRPLFWIIGGIVLIVLIVGGLLWWSHARKYESTDDAFVDAHIVRLAPQVAGVLTWVARNDNRHVNPGDLLAIIEPSGQLAQRAQAEAQLAQSRVQITTAEGQFLSARAKASQAQADTIAYDAAAAKAADDLQRYRTLLRIDKAAVAATQLDQARADAESRAGQALAARRQAQAAADDAVVARRQIDAAKAQYRASQAQLNQAEVPIKELHLTAPVAGQVVQRMVNIGSYVGPGTQLLAIVPDNIWITANYKETQLTYMHPGQHVDIQVDAFPSVHFEGHVDSIQRGAGQAFALLPPQNATGNYVKVVQRVPVRILFDRPDPRRWSIGPGMSVTPTVKVH